MNISEQIKVENADRDQVMFNADVKAFKKLLRNEHRIKYVTDYSIITKYGKQELILTCPVVYLPTIIECANKLNLTFKHAFVYNHIGDSLAVSNISIKNLMGIFDEWHDDKRTLFQQGGFVVEQGFTIFPILNNEINICKPDNSTIFKQLTIKEAKELVKSEYCTNKNAINIFLFLCDNLGSLIYE